jgi:hypothetical protein
MQLDSDSEMAVLFPSGIKSELFVRWNIVLDFFHLVVYNFEFCVFSVLILLLFFVLNFEGHLI